MQIIFALIILAAVIIGFYRRKKEDKAWRKQERFEEGGGWIDKRPGERGTFGSLDAEMEAGRQAVARQGRIQELARLIRDDAFEHYPGFHEKSDADLKSFSEAVKKSVTSILFNMEAMTQGNPMDTPTPTPSEIDPHAERVKEIILDFGYQNYPEMLDRPLEEILRLDALANFWAIRIAEWMTP